MRPDRRAALPSRRTHGGLRSTACSASAAARRSIASSRSCRALAMSGSVTPLARGTRPAIRSVAACRFDPAASTYRSSRPCRTAATSSASARPRAATRRGTTVSGSMPRASAWAKACTRGPYASLARTCSTCSSSSPLCSMRVSQRSRCASRAKVRYSAESCPMLSAASQEERIVSVADCSPPSLASTPASTCRAVCGSATPSWEVAGSGS